MLSFSFPFVTLREVKIEQPIFGANYVYGTVVAQPNGNWEGDAEFKMSFNSGGAIEFGQALLQVSHIARNFGHQNFDNPPPYTPPQSNYYAAPPPAYSAAPNGYYGWMPPTQAFPQQPPANSVFMTDAPPPYPGIVPGSTSFSVPQQQPQSQQHAGFQIPGFEQQQQQPQQYPPGSQNPYAQTPIYQFQNTGQYPSYSQGYVHGYAQSNPAFPQGNAGFVPPGPGYPQGGPGYPPGYLSMNSGYQQGNPGYPQQQQQQSPQQQQQQYPGYPPNMPSGGF